MFFKNLYELIDRYIAGEISSDVLKTAVSSASVLAEAETKMAAAEKLRSKSGVSVAPEDIDDEAESDVVSRESVDDEISDEVSSGDFDSVDDSFEDVSDESDLEEVVEDLPPMTPDFEVDMSGVEPVVVERTSSEYNVIEGFNDVVDSEDVDESMEFDSNISDSSDADSELF